MEDEKYKNPNDTGGRARKLEALRVNGDGTLFHSRIDVYADLAFCVGFLRDGGDRLRDGLRDGCKFLGTPGTVGLGV